MDQNDAEDKELVTQGPLPRDWKGIIISLIVIVVMCSLILVAVLIITPFHITNSRGKISLRMKNELSDALLNTIGKLDWIDNDQLTFHTHNEIRIINTSVNDSQITSVISTDEVQSRYGKISSWSLSPDLKFISAEFTSEEVQRTQPEHTFRIARVPTYSHETINFYSIGSNKSPHHVNVDEIQLFVWNPTSNDYVFVSKNDIYYCDGPDSSEFYQITNSSDEMIYNGIADWLYKEEIFDGEKGLWWSRSGEYLAFISIDDRAVDVISYQLYDKQQYPRTVKVPYPKTGTKELPKFTLFIWEKLSKQLRKLEIKLEESLSVYVFAVNWLAINESSEEILMAVFANRYQNVTSIALCTFESGNCVLNARQRYKIGGRRLWAEPDDYKTIFHTNHSYFIKLPTQKRNGEIYTQIAHISIPPDYKNGEIKNMHSIDAAYDIVSIKGYESMRDVLYYIAAAPLPSQRHLYALRGWLTDANPATVECVTCNLIPNCTSHDIAFSHKLDKYVLNCDGPGFPRIYLIRFNVLNNAMNSIKELSDSTMFEEVSYENLLPKSEYEDVKLSNGYIAKVKMFIPPGFDHSSLSALYPLVVSVYGGPGSQKVLENYYPVSPDTLMVSNLRYIVVNIDGRGSGMRGWKYKEPIYRNFGTVEVEDQLEVIRYLLDKYSFLDRQRVAIWGWSYGGFVAARAVQQDTSSIIKCAASIALVTDFRFYDATYTERYMADASEIAYEKASVLRNVSNFKNVKYLLIHGMADGNVHLQNSAEMIRALVNENVLFQLMMYPDDNHNLLWARVHLFTMLNDFFKHCFRESTC